MTTDIRSDEPTTPELLLLIAPETPVSDAARERHLTMFDDVMAAERGTSDPGSRVQRWIGRGVAVGAAAAVLVGAGQLLPLDNGVDTATADTLRRAAAAALASQGQIPASDQYFKVTTVYEGSEGEFELHTAYTPVDKSIPGYDVLISRRVRNPVPDLSAMPAHAMVMNYKRWGEPAWQAPTPEWLAALPRDTQQLKERLYSDTAGHGRSPDGEVVVYVADVLRSGIVPDDLRAALFEVLAEVPGVVISDVDIRAGGTSAVGYSYFEQVDGSTQELVIDPETGAYLGERNRGDGRGLYNEYVMTVGTELVNRVPASVLARAEQLRCNGEYMCVEIEHD